MQWSAQWVLIYGYPLGITNDNSKRGNKKMIRMNHVVRKHQLRRMSATVYYMSDGAVVLKSYDTIVAIELPDGTLAFSRYWTSTAGSTTTKRHITTWSGMPIKAVRYGIKSHLYIMWADVDKEYLRAIEVATGGHI